MLIFLILLLTTVLIMWGLSTAISHHVRKTWPPVGAFVNIEGMNIHFHDTGGHEDSLPIVFLHGANANLLDQKYGPGEITKGRTRLIFVDRPGCGYSERIDQRYCDPELQSRVVAKLLDHLGIERAIICGHSLGASVAASFGVFHPERCAGLMLVAPASHPWPTGVDWYYKMARYPLVAKLFCGLVVPWVGWLKYDRVIKMVFSPNDVPEDYDYRSGSKLALRGRQFFNNAMDIVNLNANVTRISKRYSQITAPTVIITGDRDGIVLPEIHARGLHRDISHSELIILPDTGHKPDVTGRNEIRAGFEQMMQTSSRKELL